MGRRDQKRNLKAQLDFEPGTLTCDLRVQYSVSTAATAPGAAGANAGTFRIISARIGRMNEKR